MKRRRLSITAVCLGGLLLVASIGVRVIGAPALVRFPLNTNETAHYTGHATLFVDAKTLLPLAHPKVEPLSVSRHVDVVSGTFGKAVVDETVTTKTPSTKTVETYQYVIDRRTMKMVNDPRQYAFGKRSNVIHAAGSYRINFAMGTKLSGSYLAYIPEADAMVPLVPLQGAHYHGDAHVTVVDFSSRLEKPVAPYYLAHLKAMGLPMQVTAAQLEPLLSANGIDVNRALGDVGSRLNPTESRLVSTTLAKSVPLRYYFVDNGHISIEPRTGALIDVHAQEQGVAVKPDLAGASVLQPLLHKYAAIPSVKALGDGLAALAKRAPQTAETYVYTQTVPSSLHAASLAHKNARMMNLVETRVPLLLLVLGLLVLGMGLAGLWNGRRDRSPEAPPEVTAPVTPEREYEKV